MKHGKDLKFFFTILFVVNWKVCLGIELVILLETDVSPLFPTTNQAMQSNVVDSKKKREINIWRE